MKTLLKIVLVLAVLGGLGAAAYWSATSYWKRRNQPKWSLAGVERGRIVSVINSTGTVKPVSSYHVGALVSGPVLELHKDFNDEVEKDELMALIDPQLYESALRRAEAAFASREAEQRRVMAVLKQAQADEARAEALRDENPDFISQAEMDKLRFNRESLEAQLDLAKAAVEQAQADRDNAQTNVEYTRVVSPVKGIVIDRKIDEGQALAAQFQTPELFVVAPDLAEKVHIYASVDETDIGLILQAKEEGQPVKFTVEAYPDELFEGRIDEIRLSSNEIQNVVTYPVIIEAPNANMKLLPGMTANISFHVEERTEVVKVPNAALRFYPPEEKYVREEDRKILQGANWERNEEDTPEAALSAEEKAELRRQRNRRHVWIVEGKFLRTVEVEVGLSDSKFSEMVSGKLTEGQQLVTGTEAKT